LTPDGVEALSPRNGRSALRIEQPLPVASQTVKIGTVTGSQEAPCFVSNFDDQQTVEAAARFSQKTEGPPAGAGTPLQDLSPQPFDDALDYLNRGRA